ncbi:MAG: hypothetical protein AABX48_00075 [Nanoarchaeota archaeon]
MTFSFNYKQTILKSGKIIYRPLIPITLIGSNESLDVIGILDSGSDMSIIPKSIAEVIGVKYLGEDEISGITGKPIKSKQGVINVEFGKDREKTNFQIPVVIPEKEDVTIIIGRLGFFQNFDITFQERKRKIHFKRVFKNIWN